MTKPRSLVKDFPILQQMSRGCPLTYLDTAASAQKPQAVIDAVSRYYEQDHANVHRGLYELSERATALYESARRTVQRFINAQHVHEVIFTKGTTEAINLVATALGEQFCSGDEIILSVMEHHSNIVPWQLLRERTGVVIKVIPLNQHMALDLDCYEQLLNERTKMVSVIHASNVLGTLNPVRAIIHLAHEKGIPVLLDGAQSVPHQAIDVQNLDCDFFAFSAHKLYGPTGVGVLYGKEDYLEKMRPYQGGGEMIRQVSFDRTEYNVLPYKFEAGTPNVAGVVGMSSAIQYLNQTVGMSFVKQHSDALLAYTIERLSTVPGLQIVGNPLLERLPLLSFVMQSAHPHDIATLLDQKGIAVRAGHHCAMPLINALNLSATVRVSLGVYNTEQDIDRLVVALYEVNTMFSQRLSKVKIRECC